MARIKTARPPLGTGGRKVARALRRPSRRRLERQLWVMNVDFDPSKLCPLYPRLCSLIPSLGVKLSTIIRAGLTVLSAVWACPPHDGVRRRWRTNVASAVVLLDARKKSDDLTTATVPAGTTFPAVPRDPCDLRRHMPRGLGGYLAAHAWPYSPSLRRIFRLARAFRP